MNNEAYYCPHEVLDPTTLRGGVRQYPEGMIGYVGFECDEDASSIGSPDAAGLAAALRRVADEIEAAL